MIYVCQCPHRLPATVWTAEDEADARRVLDLDPGANLLDALRDDHRDAYLTHDPLDLFFWIDHDEAPQATGARTAFFKDVSVKVDVEALAERVEVGDDVLYRALDGRFTWSDDDGEWTLDNQPPVEADDLFQALPEASLIVRRADRLEQVDA